MYMLHDANVTFRPDGYLLVKPAKTPAEWGEKLSLDNRHSIYYEPEPKTAPLPCSFVGCTQMITGCSILEHVNECHRRALRVTCISCQKQLTAKSYPDHVRGKHCGVSARCPYCDEPKAKGYSVTRHCIGACTALIPFHPSPPGLCALHLVP